MAEPIRWGILATGNVAAAYVEDLALLDDCEVTAVASRSLARAQSFAQRYDIKNAWDSVEDLASDEDVDVVYIATPHSHHFAPTVTCLEAGKHVLCEKAFALNTQQSQAMFDVARHNRRFLMEAMWMRCNPAIREIRRAVTDGVIGEIQAVHATFCQDGSFAAEHRMRNPRLAGGALLDMGVYPIALAHLLLGKPEYVQATALLSPEKVDKYTAVTMRYRRALAQLSCSFTGGPDSTATIVGSAGRIEIAAPFFRPNGYTLIRGKNPPQEVESPYVGHGYVHQAMEVHRMLRNNQLRSTLVPPDATLEVMKIMDDVRMQIGVEYPGEIPWRYR